MRGGRRRSVTHLAETASASTWRRKSILVRTAADDRQVVVGAGTIDGGERVEQDVDALEVAELADEQQVARVGIEFDRREIVGADTVRDDRGRAARRADLASA